MREKMFRFESMYNNWMALPFDEKRGSGISVLRMIRVPWIFTGTTDLTAAL